MKVLLVAIGLALSVYGQNEKLIGHRSYAIGIPPFTAYVQEIENATNIYKDAILHNNRNATPYLMLYNAVLDLADQVSLKGEDSYQDYYLATVLNSVAQVTNDPNSVRKKLLAVVDVFDKHSVQIKKLIKATSQQCEVPISRPCDTLVDLALRKNQDSKIKMQANLIVAGGNQARRFHQLSPQFEHAADNELAVLYLILGAENIEPLVMAVYETLRIIKYLDQLQ